LNIVTGPRDELAKTLSEHDDVDGIWYAGSLEGKKTVQVASAGNMKQTWVMNSAGELPQMDEILRHATQVKNIWVPYGA
jgi:aldehyde dehydrogenase (NAD+)